MPIVTDWKIARTRKACGDCGRTIRPGEFAWSALCDGPPAADPPTGPAPGPDCGRPEDPVTASGGACETVGPAAAGDGEEADAALGLRREDRCQGCWRGPLPEAFSWWRARIPADDERGPRRPRVDRDILFGLLRRLAGPRPDRERNFRYIVALMLLRMKALRFEDTRRTAGRSFLVLFAPREDERYEVEDPGLSADRIDDVREDLGNLLGLET